MPPVNQLGSPGCQRLDRSTLPTVTAQPVGVSSFEVGDIRLTLIPDGYHRCDPTKTLVGSTAEHWDAHRHLLDDNGRLVMTMGALLAELPGGERVLIDLGFGPRTVILAELSMEFWGGRLLASLARVGLQPDDIDAVLYSHLHIDHVGWTAERDNDGLTFGRARHLMTRSEWDHWSARPGTGGPTERDLAALAVRVELVDGESNVAPGITLVPTPGHTPGHCSFLVSSGTQRAVVLGDAIHCPLQITYPEWAFVADDNPEAAKRARERLLRELDEPGTAVVGPHFPDAVFGRVLAGTVPRRVAFDVAVPAPAQRVEPEAPPGDVALPPLT
jgi:glyoxylase-like metal-dependent hydrolase (beta-lactamase superfamily II)